MYIIIMFLYTYVNLQILPAANHPQTVKTDGDSLTDIIICSFLMANKYLILSLLIDNRTILLNHFASWLYY